MNLDVFIPISLFACIAYSIKVVVDARTRRRIVDASASQDLIRSMLEGDELQRRHAALRWGVVMLALAVGFAVIERMDWTEPTPGIFAILLGATGIGNLVYYAIARWSGR
ncbi:DUF6249 domain-containing protein [Dokdonella koreensis]|uniref:DUF6249 domain-containing protein n=1 Tax=Dokdonella koreensis DS-123 TaxID=1300342 RepID=A0A160DUW1_9GAMM|nr:DUF6249 domain-containing protein [Dokdonella koreensis]ANB17523.1 Hypothetical protein I596_1497 [Dokdonella koreensis DS-123]